MIQERRPRARPLPWEYGVAAVAAAYLAWSLWPAAGDATRTIDHRQVDQHLARAASLERAGRGEEAMVELGKALGLDPDNHTAQLRLASQFEARGQLDAAEVYYLAALALEERAGTVIQLGLLALERDRPGDAVTRFRRATELDPDSAVAQLDLGIALLRDGRAEAATAAFQAALELRPEDQAAAYNLGYSYRLLGRDREAIAVLTELTTRSPTTWGLHELGRAHAQAGHDGAARASFEAVLRLQPDHAPTLEQLRQLGR